MDRKRLIEVLIQFNINPHIINMIVQMYEGDRTTLLLGKRKETINVTCGIRQGCCVSTLLFKLVTFTFIRELRTRADLYEVGVCKENSLWLADDAVLVAKDEDSLARVLNTLEEVGKPSGLELSKDKTKILRGRGPPITGKRQSI